MLGLASLLLSGAVPRAELSRLDFENYVARLDALDRARERARQLCPVRLVGDSRLLNISDMEVREIQAVARGVVPEAIVNISPVVEGCPCEDGPLCQYQVRILATSDQDTAVLLLSNIDGRWTIGPLQDWCLSYEKLHDNAIKPSVEFRAAEESLLSALPDCRVTATSSTAASAGDSVSGNGRNGSMR
jgi:hypothetical protein